MNDDERDASTMPAPTSAALPRWARRALAALIALAVFFVHFRPWQGGLLEDWGLALAWNLEGFGGLAARVPAMLGRPLHLVPQYVGMAVSNGGFVGPEAVLGIVAVAQFGAAVWAVTPLTRVRSLRWLAALAIALHPWWAGGDILRFLPAQVAVLGTVLWLGASIRFLAAPRTRWVFLLVLAPAAGLLTYQAPAAAIVLGAVVLALTTRASWARRAALVALSAGTVGLVMVWSVVVAPRLSPASYESQLISSHIDLIASIRAIIRTLALHAPAAVVAMAVVAATAAALGFNARLRAGPAWTLLLGSLAAPLAALVYAPQPIQLHDPERVALPVGIALWIALCCALPALTSDRPVRLVLSAVILVGTVVGAVMGYASWTAYASSQEALLHSIRAARAGLSTDETLVIADRTGRFGDVYLFLPPYLNVAVDVEQGPGADAVLCTIDGVVRNQPSAELFPIGTTPDCGTVLGASQSTPLGVVTTPDGTFDLYATRPKS